MTLRNLKTWEIPFGISFHQYTRLSGIPFILTTILRLLEQKLLSNSLQELRQTLVKATRKSPNMFRLLLKKPHRYLPPWLNQRRKSMSFRNTSKITKHWRNPRNWTGHTLRYQNKLQTLLRYSKSKNRSLLLMRRKSIKSITLSKTTQIQNLVSRWLWKDHLENK